MAYSSQRQTASHWRALWSQPVSTDRASAENFSAKRVLQRARFVGVLSRSVDVPFGGRSHHSAITPIPIELDRNDVGSIRKETARRQDTSLRTCVRGGRDHAHRTRSAPSSEIGVEVRHYAACCGIVLARTGATIVR